VQRTPHPSDRRTTLATITATGQAVAREATEALHEIRFGTEPLGDEAMTAITEILREARAGAGDFDAGA
jgi:DNA-binding MarR family transcriptional regulator